MTDTYRVPIQVITVAYNRPDFIALQYYSLCKYLKAEWTYLVFSDALTDDENNDHKIKAACKKLHVQHIRVPPYIQTMQAPSPRAGNALDWALKNYVYNYDGLTLVLDSDMFLVKELDVYSFMGDNDKNGLYDIAGVIQTMSHSGYWFRYIWMALMVINGSSIMRKHPDQIRFMNGVAVEGLSTDAGGPMHYYLENHPDLHIKPLKHLWSGSWSLQEIAELGFSPTLQEVPFLEYMRKEREDPEIAGIGEMISSYFYHYRAGSNWNALSQAVVERRMKNLQDYFSAANIFPNQFQQVRIVCNVQEEEMVNIRSRVSALIDPSRLELKKAGTGPVGPVEAAGYGYVGPVGYVLEIDESFEVFPDEQVIEELILLHEGLNNPKAILSISIPVSQEVDETYDRPSLIKAHDYSLKNVLRYVRPGLEDPKVGVEVEPEVWVIDRKLWRMIFLGVEPQEEKRITSRMKRFPIRKQHHYQIVVVGQILGTAHSSTCAPPGTSARSSTAAPTGTCARSSTCAPSSGTCPVEVQLVCWGDTFFGALDAKEFSLGSDMTRIVWDFYNKFETKIDIGFRVTDNRPAAEKEKVKVEETYIIKRAYLSCLGELG